MKTTRIMAIAALIATTGLALHVGQAQLVGSPRIDLQRHDVSVAGRDAVYYGTQMRGVSNAKAKRELNFQPRPLEWIVDTAVAHAS